MPCWIMDCSKFSPMYATKSRRHLDLCGFCWFWMYSDCLLVATCCFMSTGGCIGTLKTAKKNWTTSPMAVLKHMNPFGEIFFSINWTTTLSNKNKEKYVLGYSTTQTFFHSALYYMLEFWASVTISLKHQTVDQVKSNHLVICGVLTDHFCSVVEIYRFSHFVSN